MSSIYLPNPCLLGILFTVSTHDGHQLVFHYPSSTNNYGFKATPLPQQFMEFFNADGSESESDDEDDDDGLSINNSDLELYTDDEDGRSSYTMGGMSGHDPASSSKNGGSSSFGNTVNYGNSSNTLTGKDYLDMQERIERKKRKKEEDRRNLMKRLLIQDTNNSNTNSNNSPNTNSNKNINQDSISGDRDGSTINDIINEVTSNNGSASTANTNNNANDKQDGSTSLHNTLGTVNTERDREKLRKIFGFEEEFISEIVTPPKQLCNTRFDLSVDEMTFLGLPIHVQDDGNWKKSNNNYKNNSKNSKNNKNNKNNANSANSKEKF
ncbi:unnamed protein product [[Candida] boidinii]|nr:unnamed protein product [[Candida] boidinii]